MKPKVSFKDQNIFCRTKLSNVTDVSAKSPTLYVSACHTAMGAHWSPVYTFLLTRHPHFCLWNTPITLSLVGRVRWKASLNLNLCSHCCFRMKRKHRQWVRHLGQGFHKQYPNGSLWASGLILKVLREQYLTLTSESIALCPAFSCIRLFRALSLTCPLNFVYAYHRFSTGSCVQTDELAHMRLELRKP